MHNYPSSGFAFPFSLLTGMEMDELRSDVDYLENTLPKQFREDGQVLNPHAEIESLMRASMHPKAIQLARQALGTERITLLSTAIFAKYPLASAEDLKRYIGFHQDLTYWGLEPAAACSVWMAIDDVDVENGCMQFAAGSHQDGQLTHIKGTDPEKNMLSDGQAVPKECFDQHSPVDVELKAGECSIHDGWLVHGSATNMSAHRRRCGYTSIYIPTETILLDMTYSSGFFERDWREHAVAVA
jgi:hypothetical protein